MSKTKLKLVCEEMSKPLIKLTNTDIIHHAYSEIRKKVGGTKITPHDQNVGSDDKPVYGITDLTPNGMVHIRNTIGPHQDIKYVVKLLGDGTAYVLGGKPLKQAMEYFDITPKHAEELFGRIANEYGIIMESLDDVLRTATVPVEKLTENFYALLRAEYEITSAVTDAIMNRQQIIDVAKYLNEDSCD